MTDIVIASAARTPVGAFNGSFASLAASDLGKAAISAALDRAGLDPSAVSEVVLGQVLTAAAGMNPARQASIAAGVPVESPAWSVTQVCGSGLRAGALGAQAIRNGDASIVVTGGQESMSNAPHAMHLRQGTKMGDTQMIDTMIRDGLWDVFNGYHMGTTAENVARQWQITRDVQDAFALASQNKAEAAKNAGRFKDEIVPVTVPNRKGDVVVDTDEYIRDGATIEAIQKLRPAFEKDGTVTAANASGINDGAAALLLASERGAGDHGLEPVAKVLGMAVAGVPPRIMGIGPVPATGKLLERLRMSLDDFDIIELNEAFSAQALACTRELGLEDDDARINRRGGAIALGHPLGMSGARLALTALDQLRLGEGRRALCTMCIGVGQGIALALEAV